jgi:hypothetical protein
MIDLAATVPTSAPTPPSRSAIEAALDAIAGILRRLVEAEANGELASLRRLNPDHLDVLAFGRVTLPPAVDALLGAAKNPVERADLLRRLAVITRAMASAADDLYAGWKLGGALSSVGATERRVGALLTARGANLLDTVQRTSARLAREGPLPYRQLGVLLLAETIDPAAAEALRFEVARDYARAQFQSGREGA